MAKSRKSNRRTKRVYRRKPRINKKRRLTKRKAGCSPATLGTAIGAATILALNRPKRRTMIHVGPNPDYAYAPIRQEMDRNVLNSSSIRSRPSIIDPRFLEKKKQ